MSSDGVLLQAAGVSGRRRERRAGDRHAGVLVKMETMKMEMKEQAAPTGGSHWWTLGLLLGRWKPQR